MNETASRPGAPPRQTALICPHCSGTDIRISRRRSYLGWFYQLRGLRKHRCRECRKSFFAPYSDEGRRLFEREEAIRIRRRKGWKGFARGTAERRALEILLFLGMLIIFYLTFTTIVKKDGSGIFTRPVSSDQP